MKGAANGLDANSSHNLIGVPSDLFTAVDYSDGVAYKSNTTNKVSNKFGRAYCSKSRRRCSKLKCRFIAGCADEGRFIVCKKF